MTYFYLLSFGCIFLGMLQTVLILVKKSVWRPINWMLRTIQKVIPFIQNFVFFTLFFRFLTENILIDMVSFSGEIWLLIQNKHRNLKTSASLATIALIVIIAKIAIFIFLMIMSTYQSSKLFFLHDGLKKSRCWLIFYYSHYLIVRLIYASLVLFTPLTNSGVVMIFLLITQLISLCSNFLNLYASKLLYFQTLTTREFNLLIDICIMTAL